MFIEMKNIELLEVATHKTKKVFNITKRQNHAIIIRLEGGGEYHFGSERLWLPEGGIIFLPRGCAYTLEPKPLATRWGIIRFTADTDIVEPVVLRAENYSAFLSLFEELSRTMGIRTERNRLRALSLLYRAFSMLSPDGAEYIGSGKLALLTPALDYLEEHIYDCDLRLSELSKIAGVSEVYFRRIFRLHTGRSPQQYVTERRLSRARSMLEEGAISRVGDVALAVGYRDALYFSRAFKRCYDISPSEACAPRVMEGAPRDLFVDKAGEV